MKKIEFNLPFGKKQNEQQHGNMPPPPGGPENAPVDNTTSEGIPIDLINSLKNQGMSPDQIVQTLQQQGYDPHQIYEALNQVSLKTGVNNVPSEYFNQGEYPSDPNPIQMQSQSNFSSEKVQNIIEAIVDEKWKEMTKTIDKLLEWKDKIEYKISSIQQEVKDIKESFNNLHQGILGKIGKYDKNIGDLGIEIKAMEKVFKEILPTLTDNVNELSIITKNLKE